MKYLIYLILVSFLISCNYKSQNIEYKKILKQEKLKAKKIEIDTKIIMPTKIFAVNDNIVIFDNSKKNIFKIYNLPELSFLYSFGQKGKGPNEFKAPNSNTMSVNEGFIEFVDMNKLYKYEVDKDTFILKNSIILDQVFPINNLRKLNDTLYVVDNSMKDNSGFEFILLNPLNQKTTKKVGEYDEIRNSKNGLDMYQANLKSTVASSYFKKFAVFYLKKNSVKYYDINGDLVKQIKLDNQSSKKPINKETIFFAEPVAVGKYIYVLMISKTKKAIEEDFKNFKPNLQVWDWNGEPIIEYSLNQPITSFCVSKNYKKIYGISFFNIDKIYEFDLPDTLFEHKTDSMFYKYITHEKFKAKMFNNWIIGEQMERYSSYERDGYGYERHVYHNPERVDNCGASISITSISNKKNKKIKIDEYYKKFGHINIEGRQNYELIKTYVNNQKTYHYRFDITNTDSKGLKSNNHFAVWLIDTKNSLTEVKFSSCNEFQKYYGHLEKIVSSIEIIK